MKIIKDKKMKYYRKEIFGLNSYMYFWSWFTLALAVALIAVNFMAADYINLFLLIVVFLYAIGALAAALMFPVLDKPSFYTNIVLLFFNCIATPALVVLSILNTFMPSVTAQTSQAIDSAYSGVVNVSGMLAAFNSLTWTSYILGGLYQIMFIVSIVMLVNFIKHREFFLCSTKELKKKYNEDD